MEQVRAQRAAARHGAGGGMMRARRMIGLALVACVAATATAHAQLAEQQGLRHGAPQVQRFDVDSAIARASELRRHNRRAAAAEVMREAVAAAPERTDARRFFDLLQQELHGGEALVAVNYKSWRTQLPEWKEGAVALRQNTPLRRGHRARLASRARGGGRRQGRGGGVSRLPARLSRAGRRCGDARDALRALQRVGGAVWVARRRLEGSFGYRRMNFAIDVNMVGGSLGTYVGNNLLGARVTHVLNDGGTSVLLSARHFLSDDGQFVGVRFATGSCRWSSARRRISPYGSASRSGRRCAFFVKGLVVLSADGELGRDGLAAGGRASTRLCASGSGCGTTGRLTAGAMCTAPGAGASRGREISGPRPLRLHVTRHGTAISARAGEEARRSVSPTAILREGLGR